MAAAPESDDDLILAELLCARLCHDLAGPVGAIANGAELLADEGTGAAGAGGMMAEALSLLTASAAAAGARLRFLRLAFGTTGAAPAPAELRSLAGTFLGEGAAAVTLDWPAALDAKAAACPARLLAALFLVGRDCLPRGGRLTLAEIPGGLAVTAQGNQCASGEAVAALAATAARGLGPRGAIGLLASRLAARAGLAIEAAAAPGQVALRLQPR